MDAVFLGVILRYWVYLGLLVGGITAYRVWVVLHSGLPLYIDEAQYWYWAQNLDWGYFSKPPVIAAIIAMTTSVCGDSEPCVRVGSLLFYPLSTLVLFLLARRLFDARTAWISAALFITLPAVGLSSTLISTDVALFFFWTLALYAFVRALDTDAWGDWLLLGLALGLGLMSKYTMGVFFLSALLYLMVSGRWRVVLKLRAWVAVLLAAVIFAPNLWWNWQHDFPTFQHTAQISHLDNAGLHWVSLAEFLAGQLAVFGLLFFPLLAGLCLNGRTLKRVPQAGLLLSFTLPFLLIICAQALFGRANANWAAPVYVAGTVLLTVWLVRGEHWRLLMAGLMLNCTLFVGIYHYQGLLHGLGVELTAKNDVYKRLKGWDVIGQQYLALQAQYPAALPLADERGLLSELAYYTRPAGLRIVSWNPEQAVKHHYDLVTTLLGREGQSFLYVTDNGLPVGMKDSFFSAVEQVGTLSAPIYPDYARSYQVYHLQGFKGLAAQ